MGFLEQVRTVVRTNRVFLRIGPAARGLGVTVVPDDGPPTHAWELDPWGRYGIVGTSPHLRAKLRFSQSSMRMTGLGVSGSLGVLNNHTSAGPCGALYRRGVKKDPSDALSPRGVGLTWLTTGPSRVRGDGSTLWVFWNKSALRADLRVFLRSRMPGLGVCGPSGASNITPQLAPGEHRTVGRSNRTPRHTCCKKHGRDSLKQYENDGTPLRGEWFGSTLWVLNNTVLSWPLRSISTVGGSKSRTCRTHSPKGRVA